MAIDIGASVHIGAGVQQDRSAAQGIELGAYVESGNAATGSESAQGTHLPLDSPIGFL